MRSGLKLKLEGSGVAGSTLPSREKNPATLS
jgi:hypothetical protein